MKQKRLSFILVVVNTICTCNVIFAQKLSSDSVQHKNLNEVEVTGIRTNLNSPFSKTNLTQKEIDERNLGQDLPTFFNQSASVVVSSDAGANIGYTNMRVRGTDGTRINVTLNNVPVNDAESQGTFFVNLPDLASSTSSIQLQRGVGTSTNGGGAFGATMSIHNNFQSNKASASVDMSAGSYNTSKLNLKVGTGILKNGLKIDVRLSDLRSDGYIYRSASKLSASQVLTSWQLNKNTVWRIMYLNGKEKTGQAWNGVSQDSLSSNRRYNSLGQKADGSFYNNQSDNYNQTYYQTFFEHKHSRKINSTIGLFLTRGKGFYEEYCIKESFKNYGLPNFVINNDTTKKVDLIRQLWLDNYYYGGIYGVQYADEKILLNIGGMASQYSGLHYGVVKWASMGVPDNYEWYRNDAMKNDFNQYVKVQHYTTNNLTLYADVQLRQVSYFMNGFRKNPNLKPAVNYTFFNPKIGYNYTLKNIKFNQQRAYASLAIANKEPNRNDFEANTKFLPKAEQLLNIETGYEITYKKIHFLGNLYGMFYHNQLVLNGQINDVGAYTRINVKNSYRIGVELMANYQVSSIIKLDGNITLSKNKINSYTEFVDDYDNGNQLAINYKNTDIALSPNTIAALNINLNPLVNCFKLDKLAKLSIDLNTKYVTSQFLDNTQNKNKEIPSYTLFSLFANYPVSISANTSLSFKVGIYNLLNNHYENNGYTYSYINGGQYINDNYYFPQAGRNFLFGVSLKY